MPSMSSPNSSIAARSSRPRLKTISTNCARGGGDRKYIEHLEAELSAAQNRTPPSNGKTVKMSHINVENRQLQAQLKDWETRYDEEVQGFVQRQAEVERALRNKNTHLEDYATKAKDRVAELETQLQQIQHALQAAESANLRLEKRVEIMSHLLTSTPARSELPADTPGRQRRHIRPRSMLPRLTTRGSWVGSSERPQEASGVTSPALSYTHMRDNTRDSFEPLEPIVSREVSAFSPRQSLSNAEYDSDERPFSATSTTFTDARQSIDTLNSLKSARPMRRMRRFGPGGSTKPLILPYTSHFDSVSASTSAMEQYETYPSFPLERYMSNESAELTSPARSRANTMAHNATLACLTGSSESRESSEAEIKFRRMLSLARRTSDNRTHSLISTGSDFGGLVSRNLLEELNAVKMTEKEKKAAEFEHTDGGAENLVDSAVELQDLGELSEVDDLDMLPVIQHEDFKAILLSSPMTRESRKTSTSTPARRFSPEPVEMDVFNPALEGIMGPFQNSSPAAESTPRAYAVMVRNRTSSIASHRSSSNFSLSTLDRLRIVFGDLLNNPVDVARLIIHVTQQRMHIPAPLLSVQWWLVRMLWGPMARRRLLEQEQAMPAANELAVISESGSPKSSSFSGTGAPSLAVSESLAYGTMYSSPVSRANMRRRAGGMAGPGRKRTVGSNRHGGTGEGLLARHNPILWAKFSLTLAYAVGTAFATGPGALMEGKQCPCKSCRGLDQ